MEAEQTAKPSGSKKLSKRTLKWLLVALVSALATLVAMVASQRSIGDPNLASVTIISGSFAWLIIGIFQARGTFRIGSLLLLCTLVAILASWTIPILKQSAANRRLMAKANAEGGKAQVLYSRLAKQQGWLRLNSNVAIPEIFEPLAKHFYSGQLHCELMPVDQIDIESARHARFADNFTTCLVFRGQPYDEEAVRIFAKRFHKDAEESGFLFFNLQSVSQKDLEFIESIAIPQRNLELNVAELLVPPSREELEQFFQTDAFWLSVKKARLDDDHWSGDAGKSITADYLIFEQCTLGPSFIRFLQQSPRSLQLSFLNCTFSDEAWRELANTELHKLSINSCGPMDSLLVALQKQTSLETLYLAGTFGDPALAELANIESLRSLTITPAPTNDVIRKFIKNNPNLEFIMNKRPAALELELKQLEDANTGTDTLPR